MNAPHPRARLVLLATGGTIAGAGQAPGQGASAGYTSAVVSAGDLLAAVPGLDRAADLRAEPCIAIGAVLVGFGLNIAFLIYQGHASWQGLVGAVVVACLGVQR